MGTPRAVTSERILRVRLGQAPSHGLPFRPRVREIEVQTVASKHSTTWNSAHILSPPGGGVEAIELRTEERDGTALLTEV